MRWLPNFITAVRILLTPVVVHSILAGNCASALAWSVAAGLTDGADGFLARRFGWMSRTGAYLDPVADKLLLTAVYVAMGIRGLVPASLVWLVVGRDLVILSMVAAGFLLTAIREFPPTLWGKISTALQISAAAIVLAACAGWQPAQSVQKLALWSVYAATAWSGVHYVWRGYCMVHSAGR